MATVTSRKATGLFMASWALAGCNLVSGLDEVNIQGEGGAASTTAADTTAAPGTTTEPTAGGGGAFGTGGAGGDATGGAGGAASTTSGPEGGSGGGGPTTTTGGTTSTTTTTGETTTSTTSTTSTSTTSTSTTTTTDTGQGGGSPVAECGNGTVVDYEQCDDGDAAGGDGCSADCLVEPLYQCTTGGPSMCTKQETSCDDGADNDEDGSADWEDTDCILPPYAPISCSPALVFRSVDAPAGIPDEGGGKRTSTVVVPAGVAVAHTAILLDIAHPRAQDLEITLFPPFGPPRNLTSNNGGNGADYSKTFLDSDCPTPVAAAAAPFAGCYKPEAFLPSSGQQAGGEWVLEVDDDASGEVGMLMGWSLLICTP